MFWNNISQLVFNSIIYALNSGKLHRRCVLKLILKKDKNPCFLKNWRPISLLNTDYKLLAQTFAIRLQKVLPKIISEFQNGYIKGRFIGYNIRTIIDIINYAELYKKDYLITFLDFEKAFDQLEWNFIAKTLSAFNFGPFFKNVVATMYNNVTSCVTNNGYSSEFFQITRGIRQGCPLSALLFILAVEVLSIQIQNNENIKGVTINNIELKISQLADDTTLFLNDTRSLKNSFNIINKFYECSGLKLNYSKTEVLPIGNHPLLATIPVTIVNKTCSLGIWYFDNVREIIDFNHTLKLEELDKTLNKWKSRKLTLIGKNTVVKTLAVPKLNHIISNMSTPEWFAKEAQSMIQAFMWTGKPAKIKNNVITNTQEKGGLKFPDIDVLVRSQKLAWVKRMVQNKHASWMQLLYLYLPNMDLGHILKCSIDTQCIAEYIPEFYRQILFAWYECMGNPISSLDIRRQMLWFNKYIKIDNKALFNESLYTNGLCTLNDILTEDGSFLNYTEFSNKFRVPVNRLYLMGIIHAIPKSWKQSLTECNFPLHVIDNREDPHFMINDQYKNITQIKSRDLYTSLLKKQEVIPTCIKSWNTKLHCNLTIEEWQHIFILPKLTVCDTKVIEMQYKILHRCYATNSMISKWDNTKTENCEACKQKANILHNFVTCTLVNQFWEQLKLKFSEYNIEKAWPITANDIIFGKYKHAKYDRLNHAIIYAKYYIHRQFVSDKHLSVNNFFYYYKNILEVEKQRYIGKDQESVFKTRFGKVNIILY